MALPMRNGMKDGTPEPRTPVMIMVEASWEDQSGTVQSTRARIENKSSGGACIQLNKKIAVGTRLRIEGQWERFSGEARYCRRDGRDYVVGIQKDKTEWPPAKRLVGEVEAPKGNSLLPDVEALMERTRERERHKGKKLLKTMACWKARQRRAGLKKSLQRQCLRERPDGNSGVGQKATARNGMGLRDLKGRKNNSLPRKGKLVRKGNICFANGSIRDTRKRSRKD
jgi:hypothetical protein